MVDAGTILAGSSLAIAGVVWLIRLEGHQTTHEAVDNKREALADERHNDIKDRLTGIESRLGAVERVETKVDRLINMARL